MVWWLSLLNRETLGVIASADGSDRFGADSIRTPEARWQRESLKTSTLAKRIPAQPAAGAACTASALTSSSRSSISRFDGMSATV